MSRTSFMSYYKLCLSHHYCSNSIETLPFISIYFDFLVRWNVSTVKSEGMFIDRLLGIEWRFLSPRIIVLWNVKWGHLSWRIVEIGGRQRPNVALKSASRWFLGHKHIWYAICFFFLNCCFHFCHLQVVSEGPYYFLLSFLEISTSFIP